MKALVLIGIFLFTPAGGWWEQEREAQAGGSLLQTTRAPDGASRVDWEQGFLEAVGIATCDPATALNAADCYRRALTAARILAYEKLAETLNGVAVDGQITIANELIENSELKTATRGLVRGARVTEQARDETPDGSLLARVAVRLALYPTAEESTSVVGSLLPPILATGAQTLAIEPPAPLDMPGPVTGLILDATGKEARPALSPSVVVEAGGVLYGRSLADSAVASRIGLVAYTSGVDRARRLEHRVGETPLVVTVVRADGPTKADLVVSTDDASLVAAADGENGFLHRCAVAVVLD